MWICPKCNEHVDDEFDVCWQCGTTEDGVEDPDFLHADASQSMRGPRDIVEEKLDHLQDADFAGVPPLELVECYWASDYLEAQFLADRLLEEGIPAVADQAMLGMGVSAAAWGVPYFSPRVRVRAEDLPRARAWLESYEEQKKSRDSSSE
jgi:hypothetical protein